MSYISYSITYNMWCCVWTHSVITYSINMSNKRYAITICVLYVITYCDAVCDHILLCSFYMTYSMWSQYVFTYSINMSYKSYSITYNEWCCMWSHIVYICMYVHACCMWSHIVSICMYVHACCMWSHIVITYNICDHIQHVITLCVHTQHHILYVML